MNGYEAPIGIDIFRGRYRTSFEHPSALIPNQPAEFTFGLPMIDRTIPAGHRLMVQVQSTLFPLYDRNPQTFVPNIFNAKPTAIVIASCSPGIHHKTRSSEMNSYLGRIFVM